MKKTANGTIKFPQTLHIARKNENTTQSADGKQETRICVETLFLIMVQNKQQMTYERVWRIFIELYKTYYPNDGNLAPGMMAFSICCSNLLSQTVARF